MSTVHQVSTLCSKRGGRSV